MNVGGHKEHSSEHRRRSAVGNLIMGCCRKAPCFSHKKLLRRKKPIQEAVVALFRVSRNVGFRRRPKSKSRTMCVLKFISAIRAISSTFQHTLSSWRPFPLYSIQKGFPFAGIRGNVKSWIMQCARSGRMESTKIYGCHWKNCVKGWLKPQSRP